MEGIYVLRGKMKVIELSLTGYDMNLARQTASNSYASGGTAGCTAVAGRRGAEER